MSRHVIMRDKGTRETRKKVPCQTGIGFAWVPDGQEEFEYEVTLEGTGLHKLVLRAAANANGVSVRGPLRARITNRRKI